MSQDPVSGAAIPLAERLIVALDVPELDQARGLVAALVGVGNHDAILPIIGGWARITGHVTIFIDDCHPYAQGLSGALDGAGRGESRHGYFV